MVCENRVLALGLPVFSAAEGKGEACGLTLLSLWLCQSN